MNLIIALASSSIALSPAPATTVAHVRAPEVEADYVRTVAPDGTVILKGQDSLTGRRFRFTIKNGVVRGWVGNEPVQFPLSEATTEQP